ASAIILEKMVDRSDAENKVSVYVRLKILTEEGRKYGDVEILYDKNAESIAYIDARTIKPDGKVIDFDGKIYDKVVVKAQGVKYQAKTFTLPEVQVGSIVEYRYTDRLDPNYVYDSQWVLSEDLFIKHAKYSLVPNEYYGMGWSWPRGLPPGTDVPAEKKGKIQLETRDVPAFVVEDYMPPEDELKYRVDFVYHTREISEKVPAKYWQEVGKQIYKEADDFMDEKKAMGQVVSQIIQPGDSADSKLRKLYAHVQQLRNLSYEKEKTEQEAKRENLKQIHNVAHVEKYGYGDATQLTYLYVALARAAGFDADMVFLYTRNKYFFQPNAMNSNQLTSNVAVVNVDGKDLFLEPGMPYVPFGLLPWHESGVSGLRITKDGGSWVTIPFTKPSQAQTQRKAMLKLDEGVLNGTVTVTYTGLEAIYHRLEERLDDVAARKEYVEAELKRVIPTGADVTLGNEPDWNGVDTPLVVEYKVKIPGWASSAGKRLLMPIGVFSADEKHTFEQEKRIHPIYFHYANVTDDDITIELPTGLQVGSVPKARNENIQLTSFASSVEASGSAIRITRNLSINGVYMPEKYYLALRDFYQEVRANDEEQIVLIPVTTSAAAKATTKN
ncbi:MAG: DUF3857 domain-containing protein, partial [Steroidobacter sp.]